MNRNQYDKENQAVHKNSGGLVDLNTQWDMRNEIILVVKYIMLEYTWGGRIIMRSKHSCGLPALP